MAEETTSDKKKSKKTWLWIIIILLLVAAATITTFVVIHHTVLAKIKSLLVSATANSSDPAGALKILTDIANELISDPMRRQEIKDYANSANISYEQAVVDVSIKTAQGLGYIA